MLFRSVPSLIAGGILIGPMLFEMPTLLGNSIFVLPQHDVLLQLAHEFHGAKVMALTAGSTLAFWLALAGIITAWVFNAGFPGWAESLKKRFSWAYAVITHKYGFDDFNQMVIVHGSRKLGHLFYDFSDIKMIDGVFVNGSGTLIRWFASVARRVQTGFMYHYALAMILGLVFFLGWLLLRF